MNGLASRRGAEIDYLNRRAEKWESLDKNNSQLVQEWNSENPRWEKLLEVKCKKSLVSKMNEISASWRSHKNRKSRHYPQFKDYQDQTISKR